MRKHQDEYNTRTSAGGARWRPLRASRSRSRSVPLRLGSSVRPRRGASGPRGRRRERAAQRGDLHSGVKSNFQIIERIES